MNIDTSTLSIRRAAGHLAQGDFTALQLAEANLKTAEEKTNLNMFLEVFEDVREQAVAADKIIKEGKQSLLTGIPLAFKDNILIQGRRASAGSKILEGYKATYDATAVKKLKTQGGIFFGRTNMDEFAMGSSTENSAYEPVKNPHDESRVPGGSSGGSAAAVASNAVLGAFGSDTGGSVRQPASFCGVVGLKPTYGAVSRNGLIAMGSSLDQIGAFGKNIDDVAILFDAISGHDPLDSTSVKAPAAQVLKEKPVIGIPRHLIEREGIDADVLSNFNEAVSRFKSLGYEIKEIELPNAHHALAVYYILMPAEVSSNLARFDGVKYGLHVSGKDLLEDYLLTRQEGFGREVRRRIILGTYVLSSGYYDAYYNKAVAARKLLCDEFAQAYKNVDVILTPTCPTPAFKIGEKTSDPLAMYLSDIFTVPANIVGVPALSFPSGTVVRDEKTLPLGIQLMGRPFEEKTLFSVSSDFLTQK